MSAQKNTREERSWIMYDWANSVYATIIMAAIFPIYFASMAPNGDVWWGYATSIATFVTAILAPVLGAAADYAGMKKKLFSAFLIVGVVFTSTMALTENWKLLMVGYIISYIGFSGSCLFYDSFLTDVTTAQKMDSISAKGYAMGYIGGSTIPFLIAIAMISFMPDSVLATKLSVVLTSVWWAVFSIPFLRDVKQTHSIGKVPHDFLKNVFKNVGRTFKDIIADRSVFLFILAYFFYIDGVNTVIHMSTAYGSTLGLGTMGMVLALMVTQIVAAPCAVLFSRFSRKIGSVKMIGIAIGIYFLVCCVGFYMGFSLENAQDPYTEAFDSAASSYSGETADYLALLRDDGINALSAEDKAAAFGEKCDAYIADAPEAIAASAGTAINAVRDAVTPVLSADFSAGYDKALDFSQVLFWCMAILVGTSQGGIQALSRSFFGKLIPAEKSNEYYGFFDIFGKFAAVMGPALYSLIKSITGRSSFGILALMTLFAVGGLLLIAGRKRFRELESRTIA